MAPDMELVPEPIVFRLAENYLAGTGFREMIGDCGANDSTTDDDNVCSFHIISAPVLRKVTSAS